MLFFDEKLEQFFIFHDNGFPTKRSKVPISTDKILWTSRKSSEVWEEERKSNFPERKFERKMREFVKNLQFSFIADGSIYGILLNLRKLFNPLDGSSKRKWEEKNLWNMLSNLSASLEIEENFRLQIDATIYYRNYFSPTKLWTFE